MFKFINKTLFFLYAFTKYLCNVYNNIEEGVKYTGSIDVI